MATAEEAPAPLYQQVKDLILGRICNGDWPEGHRVPSENELTRELGFSRMTVHRALRELTAEGWLTRVRGLGTFVAGSKPQSPLLELHNIADDIASRGHRHASEVHILRAERADEAVARGLGVPRGARVFHSLIVHRENGVPVQLEERHVNPEAAPDYLEQDFTALTPNQYLMRAAPLAEAEHVLEAVLPDIRTQRLLRIGPGEPCLLLHRRTWSGGRAVTQARLIHPGSRYRLGGRFRG